MAKQYSIAEARAQLPTIVDEVEGGKPVQLTRRGKPVAVVLSLEEYQLLSSPRPTFADAYRAYRGKFALEEVGLEPADFPLRASDRGRRVDL